MSDAPKNSDNQNTTGGDLCETCEYYTMDEDDGTYFCDVLLDMDEVEMYMRSGHKGCPYYRGYDEYQLARKQ